MIKTIGKVALVILLVAIIAGGVSRLFGGRRMMGPGFNRSFSQQEERSSGADGSDQAAPEDAAQPRFERPEQGRHQNFDGRSFGMGRSGRGLSFLGVVGFIRDIFLIGLVVLVAIRFTNVRQWFGARSPKQAQTTTPPAEKSAADLSDTSPVEDDPPTPA